MSPIFLFHSDFVSIEDSDQAKRRVGVVYVAASPGVAVTSSSLDAGSSDGVDRVVRRRVEDQEGAEASARPTEPAREEARGDGQTQDQDGEVARGESQI